MRGWSAALVAGLLVPLLSAAPAASQSASSPKADWRGTGTVVAVLPPPSSRHATRPGILIHHAPLHGLMEEARGMPFTAASTRPFAGLRARPRRPFRLHGTPD